MQEGGTSTLGQVLAEQVKPLRELSGVLEVAGLRAGAIVLGLAADAVAAVAKDDATQVDLVELVLWSLFHADNLLESLSHGAVDHPDQSLPVVSALLSRLGRPPMAAWELFGIPTPRLPADITVPPGSPRFALGAALAWALPRVIVGCYEVPGLNGFLPGLAAEVSRMTHISRAAAASEHPVPSDLADQTLADLRRVLFGLAEALRALDDADPRASVLPRLDQWPAALHEVVQAFGLEAALPRQAEREFSSKIQAGLNASVVMATTKAASAFMTQVADRLELGQPITAEERATIVASMDFVGLDTAQVKEWLSGGPVTDTVQKLGDLAKSLEDRAMSALTLRSLPDNVEAARPHMEGVLIELGTIKSEVQLAVEAAGDLERLPSSLGPTQAQRLSRVDSMLTTYGLTMMAPYASKLGEWISDLSTSPSIQLDQLRPWAQALGELEYAIESLRDGARACADVLLATRQTLALAGYDPLDGLPMEANADLIKRSVPTATAHEVPLVPQELDQNKEVASSLALSEGHSRLVVPTMSLPEIPVSEPSVSMTPEGFSAETPMSEAPTLDNPLLELAPLDMGSIEDAVPEPVVPAMMEEGLEVEDRSWLVHTPDAEISDVPALGESDVVFEIDTIKEEISRGLVEDTLTGGADTQPITEKQKDIPTPDRIPSWKMGGLPLPELDFGSSEPFPSAVEDSSAPMLPLHIRDLVDRELPQPHGPVEMPSSPAVPPLNSIRRRPEIVRITDPESLRAIYEVASSGHGRPEDKANQSDVSLFPVLIVPFDSPAAVSIDMDMQEVFGEEIHEEIASLAEWIPDLFQVPPNPDIIYNIRKSFHTIKGSGRMVGAATLGEMAWAVEGVLNRVMEKRLPLSESVISLVLHANSMVVQFERSLLGEPACWDTRTLIDWANELQRGVDKPSPFPSSIDWSALALTLVEAGPQQSILETDETISAIDMAGPEPAHMELSLAQDIDREDASVDMEQHSIDLSTTPLELVDPDSVGEPLSFEIEIEQGQQPSLAASRPAIDEPMAELASANLEELPILDLDVEPVAETPSISHGLPWETGSSIDEHSPAKQPSEGLPLETLSLEDVTAQPDTPGYSAPLPASSIFAPTDWTLSNEIPVQEMHVAAPAVHIETPNLSLIPIEEDEVSSEESAPLPAPRGFGGQSPSEPVPKPLAPVPPASSTTPVESSSGTVKTTPASQAKPLIPDLPKAPTPVPERTIRPLSHDVILQGTDWKVLLANAQDQAIAARTALEAGDVNQALACIDRQVPALDRLAELVLVLERASKLASRINRENAASATSDPPAIPAQPAASTIPQLPVVQPAAQPTSGAKFQGPAAAASRVTPRKEPVAVIPERKLSFFERWFLGRSKKKK